MLCLLAHFSTIPERVILGVMTIELTLGDLAEILNIQYFQIAGDIHDNHEIEPLL